MPARNSPAAPEVSVVVATHERPRRLLALLDRLRRQTIGGDRFELIVVDDGSADETPELLAREASRDGLRVEVVARERSGGPAAARNSGWPAATAPLVAFTDDDCEPEPGWLEALLAAAGASPGAAVQGRTEPIPAELPGAGPFSRILSVNGLGPYFQTCNIAYPRQVLERLGGFDEAFAEAGEDTDLGWRAKDAGVPIVYAEDALVHHAVNEYGPLGKLRWALHWSDAMQVIARHPQLRRQLRYRIFWKESHARLLLALFGVLIGRRFRLGLLLTVPYLQHLRDRCKAENAPPLLAPYLTLYDGVETYATIRGALRYRVPVL